MAVYDEDGTKLISYKYDAWGNFTTTYHNGCTASSTANYNPFRYRGYYYDVELGMYYLQSRYYDSVIGRFITRDGFSHLGANGDLIAYNLYAYCSNNPVNYADSEGKFLCTIIGAIVGGICGAVEAAINGETEDEFWASVAGGAVAGAISGAAADILLATGGTAGVVAGVMAIAGAAGSLAERYVEAGITGEKVDWENDWGEILGDMAFDAATGALFGYIGGDIAAGYSKVSARSLKKATKEIWKMTKRIFRKEVRDLGENIAEEFLTNATTSLMEFTKDIFVAIATQSSGR